MYGLIIAENMLKISDIKLNKVSVNHRDSQLGRIYRIRVHVVSNPSGPATVPTQMAQGTQRKR